MRRERYEVENKMTCRKKILAGVGVFVVLVAGAVFALPFVIDVNKYTEKIESLIEEQIRGDIDMGTIRLSFWPYIGFDVDGITAQNREDVRARFGEKPLLSLDHAAFKIGVRSLFKGKIVATLVLDAPRINLIKDSQDITNLTEFLPPPTTEEKPSASIDFTSNPWVARILIDRVELSDGDITTPDLVLKPFNLKITDIQLNDPTKPMRIESSTSYQQVSISLTTGVWLDLARQTVRLGEGVLSLGGGAISFEVNGSDILKTTPTLDAQLNATNFSLTSLGTLAPIPPEAKIDPITFSLNAHSAAALSANGSAKIAKISYGTTTLTSFAVEFSTDGKSATLEKGSFTIFDGTATASGKVTFGEPLAYTFTANADQLDVSKMTTVATGKASASISGEGIGFDQPSIEKNLQAKGELKLADGKILTLNLVNSVFSEQIAGIMKTALAARASVITLPGRQEEGTPYKTIFFPFTVVNGRLQLENVSIVYDDYEGLVSGSLGLDLSSDLTGRLLFSPQQTATIIADEKIRGYIADDQGRLVIPFHIGGNLTSPTVTPDGNYVQEMFARAAKKLIEEEAKKIVKEKVIPKAQEEIKKAAPELEQKAKDILKKLF